MQSGRRSSRNQATRDAQQRGSHRFYLPKTAKEPKRRSGKQGRGPAQGCTFHHSGQARKAADHIVARVRNSYGRRKKCNVHQLSYLCDLRILTRHHPQGSRAPRISSRAKEAGLQCHPYCASLRTRRTIKTHEVPQKLQQRA
jgi:hypothetical protein